MLSNKHSSEKLKALTWQHNSNYFNIQELRLCYQTAIVLKFWFLIDVIYTITIYKKIRHLRQTSSYNNIYKKIRRLRRDDINDINNFSVNFSFYEIEFYFSYIYLHILTVITDFAIKTQLSAEKVSYFTSVELSIWKTFWFSLKRKLDKCRTITLKHYWHVCRQKIWPNDVKLKTFRRKTQSIQK